MRSRASNAATAKAFALAISQPVDVERASHLLAERWSSSALLEALSHLERTLFEDDDRVSGLAAELLAHAAALGRAA